MKAVIDTNVLVSGLIKQGTPPAEVLADALAGVLTLLYDHRLIDEYREVLARPKFKLESVQVEQLLDFIVGEGIEVLNAQFDGRLPDADDQPFADVAFTGGADLLLTGNVKDFPLEGSIRVVTPREWLDIKRSQRLLRELGEDERLALERNGPFPIAIACERCRHLRTEQVLGLAPASKPMPSPLPCSRPNPKGSEGRCGGVVWSYAHNELGREQAKALGIPTLP